jgi:hypothetical protein
MAAVRIDFGMGLEWNLLGDFGRMVIGREAISRVIQFRENYPQPPC